jgi:hypothetical protein
MIGLSLFQTIPLIWTNHQGTNFVLVKEARTPDLETPKGWALLDSLDVGNVQEENLHNYQIEKEANVQLPTFGTVPEKKVECAGDQSFLWDKGRVYLGAESFIVQTREDFPLFIEKRIHGDIGNQVVKVLVNDREAGDWKISERAKGSFRSSFYVISASFIQTRQVRLKFQFVSSDSVNF